MFMLASLMRGKESGKWKNVLVNFGTSAKSEYYLGSKSILMETI